MVGVRELIDSPMMQKTGGAETFRINTFATARFQDALEVLDDLELVVDESNDVFFNFDQLELWDPADYVHRSLRPEVVEDGDLYNDDPDMPEFDVEIDDERELRARESERDRFFQFEP